MRRTWNEGKFVEAGNQGKGLACRGSACARTVLYVHTSLLSQNPRGVRHSPSRCSERNAPWGVFPKPEGQELDAYLEWDDWKVLGCLHAGEGGKHGDRLARRDHYREVYSTNESASRGEIGTLRSIKERLGNLVADEYTAEKSWYKIESDIQVLAKSGRGAPLSKYSPVVKNLAKINQIRLYAKPEDVSKAKTIVEEVNKK
jgi:hypothetical protein